MNKMNKLFEFIEKETKKCVHCGKCKSVCDMYLFLREEEYSPRGLVQLAKNLKKIDDADKARVLDYFYTCFLCLKCSVK
ncbi:MAG TPA: (Fe-S)-binding protein, partial [Firmicutes bacterium]|nr:(Fe-S)-binding protein [Bacillota bacterium]